VRAVALEGTGEAKWSKRVTLLLIGGGWFVLGFWDRGLEEDEELGEVEVGLLVLL